MALLIILSLFKISLLIILADTLQLAQCAPGGNQKIVRVSELITSGEDDNSLECCVYGRCFCSSLDHALANLTSNVLINITTNVTLSSIVRASDLDNISLTGHNNPTVNCRSVGGIHLKFCLNCIVQGITWDGCGAETVAGLTLTNSSNITISNCSFQRSKGQAVSLSGISGDVNISHCNFAHNNHYRGHGAAIHYSSSHYHHLSVFTIGDCNFTYNYAISLVYIGNNDITFSHNTFCHNQGVSVYGVNPNIYLKGKNLFQNNTAKLVAGIYIRDYSTVIFSENSCTTFTQNVGTGGTVFLNNHSNLVFDKHSMTKFSDNQATAFGGAIYSHFSSIITFKSNCNVTFNHNSAEFGGAVACSKHSRVIFDENSIASFNDNMASISGGAISCYDNSYIYFEGNSSLVFSNNTANDGGAIHSDDNSYIYFKGDASPTFSGNVAAIGGAISSSSYIVFSGNSSPLFNNNIVDFTGGSIYSSNNSYIHFEGNSFPIFSNNIAASGGAISFNDNSHILFEGNSSPVFINNTAQYGGAIFFDDSSNIFFKDNTSTVFSNNTAYYEFGGAIVSLSASSISFQNFSTVVFSNNFAENDGAAVFADDHCDMVFSDNSTVMFTNNKATFDGIISFNSKSKITATGGFTVIINDVTVKWCNSTCLPYADQDDPDDVIAVDSNGIIWCSDKESFICPSKKCYCTKFEDLLDGLESNVTVNITNTVTLSSIIALISLNNILIIGHNNITVICANGGGLYLASCSNVIIEGITWIGCGYYEPVIELYFSNVIIQKCTFQHSYGQVIALYGIRSNNVSISNCNFINNNHYNLHGAAIFCPMGAYDYEVNININNCNFSYNQGDAFSIVYFDNEDFVQHNIYLNNSNFYNNQGVPVYVSKSCTFHIIGEVRFENNMAENGAGIYISNNSTVIFDKLSGGKFINNSVVHNGAAIFLFNHSTVIFEQNSLLTFHDHRATNGTVYSKASSNVMFKGNCEVTFSSNSATQYGAAIYSADNSHVTFTGNSQVTFDDNIISSKDRDLQYGGNIYSENNGHISFEGNSFTMFSNNTADFGAAIFSYSHSSITFKESSKVIFNNNMAQYCGALSSVLFSSVIYKGNTIVSYNANTVSCTSPSKYKPSPGASAMCTFQKSDVIFSGHSLVTYTCNTAGVGGAAVFSNSDVIIEEYSTVSFNDNIAQYSAGALACNNNSNITIKGNSSITFNSNKANQNGGAISSYNMCKIIFKGNSTSTFISNTARNNGGAISSDHPSKITFDGNSSVIFNNNTADNGGSFYFSNSSITIKEKSMISFYNNKAIRDGGAGYLNIHCAFILEDNAKVIFDNNKAFYGGAIFIDMMTKFIIKGYSTMFFYNNLANEGGGALKATNNSSITLTNHVTIKFANNSAQYGSGIFLDTTAIMVNNSANRCMDFTNNIAKISGNSIYQDVSELCTSSCLSNRIMGINREFVDTPPNKLKFNDQATCIDNGRLSTQCNSYFIKNVMLGKPILMSACVSDFYNQSVDSLQFLVQGEANLNYHISGPKQVVISCDALVKISIIGNQSLSKSMNFTITISLNTALYSDWKQISANLITELSSCHPGFWQYPSSTGCECYNVSDIVFCSGSSSTIKRGYWIGSVTGKPTVTFCPINYCNFTCCETSNGYYHLSPIRDNQCTSHRSGIACGSCEEGYTLSFDSVQCVNVNECTTGKKVVIAALILLYWIAIITAVFSMMYFKVGIGYLYVITYYYSVVDLLLSQNWYLSSALSTTVNIMSSIAKIIPQFLGKFCFIANMSGIDQQFIHYIHPVAITLFLIMVTVLARRSRKLSNLISKGIIHVICCLLLLSYTSFATTSLLLMRPLIFHDVDKVYTYVSPDIEYLHGRHLAYAIVAMLFTIVIVIGLPLLLALEPFLNSKINFIKVKPLLDQFQSCYKDKYRCFAAYYMICRLVIITIIIANPSNDFVFQYSLITACVIMASIHQNLKPYSNSSLNDFDGTILLFLVLISALPLVNLYNFGENLLVGITFILVVLPLLIFITMSLLINKDKIKKLPKYCYTKCTQLRIRYHEILLNEPEESPDQEEFVSVIDDSRRVNATICDV